MTAPQYSPSPNWHDTITEVDDSTPPEAANWNPGTEALADNILFLKQSGSTLPTVNWTPQFAGQVPGAQLGIGWDPTERLWLEVVQDDTTTYLYMTPGLDLAASAAWSRLPGFVPSGTPNFGCCSADPNSAGAYYVAETDSVGANNHWRLYYWDGSNWSLNPGVWVTYTAGGEVYGTDVAIFKTYLVVACAGTGSNDSRIVSSNDAFATEHTFSVALTPGANVLWYLKSNSGAVPAPAVASCVAILGGAGGAGFFSVYQTIDGHTWTTSVSLAAIAPVGGQVMGLAWTRDALGPCWVVAITTTDGHVKFFRSPDGLAWTAQSGGLVGLYTIVDMASTGFALVATLADESSGGPSGTIFSIDGGVSWYPSPAGFFSNTVSGLNRSRIIGQPVGFMMANGTFNRFSNLAGLPPASL